MLPLGFAAFLLFGVVLVLLGATQDAISTGLGLSLAEFGMLGSALAAGMGIGVVGAGPLVDRLPRRPIFAASTLFTAAALGLVSADISFARLLLHAAALGLGVGVYDTLLNAVTVERYEERAVRYVSLLHASVTIGAMAAPPIIGWLIADGDWTRAFRATGASFALLSLWVALVPLPAPQRHEHLAAGIGQFANPAFASLCIVGFVYVGIEAALVMFSIPYATQGLALDAARGRGAISAFWLGILVARIALALRHDAGARALSLSGAAGAVVLALGVGLEWRAIEWLVGLAGAALGLVFPLMISLAGQWHPRARGAATGLVAGVGSLGGFLFPWLTGFLGDALGVRVAFASLALWCLCIPIAAIVALRSHARSQR